MSTPPSLTYVHSFWTRPWLAPQGPEASPWIELWDFELLTWLASALEIRRHSPLRLVTDTRGRQFVERGGLAWVYADGISTDLDAIPADLNASVFWAAGKLYALRFAPAPCVSVDTDAILWQPLVPDAPLVGLHTEDRLWPWYADDEHLFRGYGFMDAGWDWSIDPLNTAVAYFAEEGPMAYYRDTAIQFMLDYSRAISAQAGESAGLTTPSSDPMIFAEQRLLPMCAARLGVPMATLSTLAQHGHLAPNPLCTHLWSSKVVYMSCAEARTTYVNHLIHHLLTNHPECRETLAHWNLDRPKEPDPTHDLDLQAMPDHNPQKKRFSLLQRVSGTIWIDDANVVGVRRRARDGALVWASETIRPEPGATFDLVVGGQDKIRIQQSDEPAA